MKSIFNNSPDPATLWDGKYKIPWDEPDFSYRMLKEHLFQEHDLASRKLDMILKQVQWIHKNIANSVPGRLLDIGCGPGLYIEQFLKLEYDCCGIDFSPASIEYAKENIGDKAQFIKEDVRFADFGTDYEIAMMLFGELNVFSPNECKQILKKTYDSLLPGGKLLIELQKFEAVQRFGKSQNTWYKSGPGLQGLFSDKPHICLIENHWFADEQTALQLFHIIDVISNNIKQYRSTTKAWPTDEFQNLLADAGFVDVVIHKDWPVQSNDFTFFSALKQ